MRLPVAEAVGFMPGPELDWQIGAPCSQTDPELFFPEKGGTNLDAKRICLGCPVQAECLEYALKHDEPFGMWGGLTRGERQRLVERPGQGARTDRADLVHGLCRKGLHIMAGENLIVSPDGGRRCAACRRLTDREAQRTRRERAERGLPEAA